MYFFKKLHSYLKVLNLYLMDVKISFLRIMIIIFIKTEHNLVLA